MPIHYGAANFLWISDVAVFLTFVAVWTGSRLLASSQLVGVLLINVAWTIDVVVALLTGVHPIGGTEYMFDGEWPLYLRLMSLFHLWVPLVLVFLVVRIGYTGRGVAAADRHHLDPPPCHLPADSRRSTTSTGSAAPSGSRRRWPRRASTCSSPWSPTPWSSCSGTWWCGVSSGSPAQRRAEAPRGSASASPARSSRNA
jgi:hypothetical protein